MAASFDSWYCVLVIQGRASECGDHNAMMQVQPGDGGDPGDGVRRAGHRAAPDGDLHDGARRHRQRQGGNSTHISNTY